ncbi:glycosyltransferase family 9 protein [Glaciecola siphonariae]|uniref:Glycosyltransferase family 9 protein n=1 Tax=Glaciecola siphonariae TaxID=521012 RepID=A0ABV9LW07_9ALTE
MSQPFKLCILRLSAIGDVCHAAAMVNAILQHQANTEITWVIGKIEYALLKGMQNVNFVVYDKKGGKQAKQAVVDALGEVTFDALFVMQVALRANLLSRIIKAKRRIGFDWARSKEGHYLFTNERIKPQEHAHVLEGFMGFAHAIGVPESQSALPCWNIPIDETDSAWAEHTLAEYGRFAVISPAASKAERNWLPQRYAKVAEYLHSKGMNVVLCGGPGPLDVALRDEITRSTDAIALDLVGKTTLKQMLAVLDKAALVIAPDTGPAHMATTQGTPVVGLYAHSNPRRTGPYLSQDFTASVYDECILQQTGKQWEQLPWGRRAKGDSLMANISLEQVIARIDAALGAST